jgi:L-malate glycosyltransferase
VRILQVSSARHFGGGERHFVDLCRGLHERGHEVFAALRPTNRWQQRLDFLPAERILHVSLRNAFGVLSAQRIAEFVNENKIEIVHAHAARDYIPASLACRIAKSAKFVLTRHVLFPMKPFHRYALTNLSKAIAVSGAVAENLQKIFPKEKIRVAANGIRVENWANADAKKLREEFRFLHEIPFDSFLIGTLGELIELKGQREFVLAANEIARKFPESFFLVVGKDNSIKQEFRRELRRLIKVFDLENRFLFLDWVEDTAQFFHALDVFVSPSRMESFGLAILEAMASGKAIVATETDGARELLQNDFSAKLTKIKEPLQLADAVEEFLRDENLRARLGANAQATAREKFGLERMIDEIEKIYAGL